MEANQLRIGNLVNWNGEIGIISQILEQDICFKCGEETLISDIKPIPITEEWLLKFGFKKVRYEKYAHEKLNKFRAYPHVMKNGFGIYLMGSYTFPHIKYVHQVQNLYFALTGEELKVNL